MLDSAFTPADDSILSRYTHNGVSGKKAAHWLPALQQVRTIWIFFVPIVQTGDGFRHWL